MSKGLTFILDKKQSRSDMAKHGYSVLICSIIIYIIMYGLNGLTSPSSKLLPGTLIPVYQTNQKENAYKLEMSKYI